MCSNKRRTEAQGGAQRRDCVVQPPRPEVVDSQASMAGGGQRVPVDGEFLEGHGLVHSIEVPGQNGRIIDDVGITGLQFQGTLEMLRR